MELTSADHEVAVEAIQTSSNPIQFVVQSLQHWVSEISLSKQILNDTWFLQPNKERKATEDLPGPETLPPQSDPGTARVPSKLIIPDIFCGQSKTSNKVCVNGMSTSSSNRWLQAVLMRKSFELKLVPQIMLTEPQKLLINIAFHYEVDPYWLYKREKVGLPGSLLFFGIEKYYKCRNVCYFSYFDKSLKSTLSFRSESPAMQSSLNMEPEFNERRHSESVVKSRNHLGKFQIFNQLWLRVFCFTLMIKTIIIFPL